MQFSVKEIAQLVGGDIEGDAARMIFGPSRIEEGNEGTISFLANPRYEPFLYTTQASAVLVNKTFQPSRDFSTTLIRVEDVYSSVGQLLTHFNHSEKVPEGISPHAEIATSAKIGDNVIVGAFSFISDDANLGDGTLIYPQVFVGSNVTIGKNCILYPGVRIYHDCYMGDECVIHANTVIGSDGFGFSKVEAQLQKIPQIGNVILKDRVEIGSNCVIDRATMGSTVIEEGAKLDNLIQIAHNVKVGESTAIAAQAGIAGSAKIGKGALIGGQVGIAGHIEIADGVQIQAKSGIASSEHRENVKLYGYPALDYARYLKSYAVFKQLPSLLKKVQALEKELDKLREKRES